MKFISSFTAFCLIAGLARAAAPTPASVEKLLIASSAEKPVASMTQQMDGFMQTIMDRSLAGKNLTPKARELADRARPKLVAIVHEELNWEKTKALYMQVYTETFTQEDIDGLIAFYESPTGHAFVSKMPMVSQKTMALMQQRMGPIMEKVQRAMAETMAEVDALDKAAAAPAASAPPGAGKRP